MTIQESTNLEFIRGILRDFVAGNYDAVEHAFDENIDWFGEVRWLGGPELPFTGAATGKQEVMETFKSFLATVEYQGHLRPTSFVAQGNRVVATGLDLRMHKPTGQQTENRWTMIWTIENEKVTRFRILEDTVEKLG